NTSPSSEKRLTKQQADKTRKDLRSSLRKALTPGSDGLVIEALTLGERPQEVVRPVVLENDVGYIYVTRMLKKSVPKGIDVVPAWDAAALAEHLKTHQGDDFTRRVLICDEVLALNTLAILKADSAVGGRAELVFSLTDKNSVQEEKR